MRDFSIVFACPNELGYSAERPRQTLRFAVYLNKEKRLSYYGKNDALYGEKQRKFYKQG